MDFRYSDEQLALQDTLQRFSARSYTFEQRRAISRTPQGHSAAAWRELADLGVLALPLTEEHGGLGGNGVDVMLVMEQFGRALLLEPYLSTVVFGASLLQAGGAPALRQELLPRIAAGEVKLAVAAYEAAGRYRLQHIECRAQRHGSRWRLEGRKAVVLDAPAADYLIVAARVSGASASPRGISLFLVARDRTGVTVVPYATQSGGRAADVELKGVELEPAALIGAEGQGLPLLERALQPTLAALCAEALGVIGALNEATLEHLKSRRQFGVPIGTFQALQHRMADMYIAAEQARSMTILAAVHAQDVDLARQRRIMSAAKAYVGRAARFVGQQAVQLHGGMGLVDDVPVSHYFKRLTMIDLTYGDAAYHFGCCSDSLAASGGAPGISAAADGGVRSDHHRSPAA
jgi:alkylation response protein AidB-like acyl-CoA dehydrogenase